MKDPINLSIGQPDFPVPTVMKEAAKAGISGGMMFEDLGFRYVGPIDGHKLDELLPTLENITHMDGPVLMHVVTKKGKGYPPAEENPHLFHGVGPFDPATGEIKKGSPGPPSYTAVFGQTLTDLAEKDDRIVAITAAMLEGTGLAPFAAKFPDRCFDVGIAEQHAVTYAAGMATLGIKPVLAIYSTFLQRAYDNVLHDVCLQNLPVTFALDRGGLVGADGPTHHGVFDLSYLRHIPNLVFMIPRDENYLRHSMATALAYDGPFAFRYPLVDGQGNFGSIDGDPPGAMRYTEARMRKISEDMLADIDKETVDHQLNFDDTLNEPTVLPTRIPGLLVNGASGIAVGMATNMPPHNLSEVVDGIVAYIEDKDIEIDELIKYVKAPDFPTGGTIYGYDGVKEAFHTGRGRIVMRAKANIEEVSGRECIIVTEIPYQVNKADMIKKTADLVNDKKLEGIATIRDESDRNGMRIVYVLKRDAIPNIVLNKLYKYTQLQSSFSVNNIALVKGRPQLLNLKEMIHHFVDHRHEVVVRRTTYELRKAEERAHILEGLIIASDNIDEVIALIRASSNADEAREKLMTRFELSELQAKAIVEMRLRQLTGLEQDKLRSEYEDLMNTIEDLKDILDKKDRRMEIIKEELLEVKNKYGDERRSIIEYAGGDLSIEDIDKEKYNIYPLYATIHSGISFNTYLFSKWDSGAVGYIAVRKNKEENTINYIIEKLDAIYNGWIYEVSLVKQSVCKCCNQVENEEYGESYLCFTSEEVDKAIKELKEDYNAVEEEA